MNYLQQAIEQISAQQEKLKKNSAPWYVGEQLKEILNNEPPAAEIVLQDLKTKGMGLEDCEKKIAAYASKNRTGSVGCCPPKEADRIIREFYGIPASCYVVGIDLGAGPDLSVVVKAEQKHKKINLANFL